MVHRYFPYRKKIIQSNIDQVFGEALSVVQKRQLAQSFYSHLATSIKEMLMMRFMTEQQICDQVEVKGHEYLLEVAKQNKGRFGINRAFWQLGICALGGILNFKQFQGQFHFIRRTLGNKFLEKILFRRYYRAGLNVIPKKNSLEQVTAALEKNHAVAFVLDQHASLVNRDGVAAEFFGKKAGTYRSLASISRHTGIPVIPAAGYRFKKWETCFGIL